MRSGGLWVDGSGLGVSEAVGSVAGLRFTGLPTATDFLLTAATLSLRARAVGATQVPALIRVYARNASAPAVYSSSNPPPLLRELTPLSDSLVATRTLTSAGDMTLTLTLSLAALNTARAFAGGAFTALALHVHVQTADGTALVFDEGETGTAAVLTVTTDTRTFTGMQLPHGETPVSVPDACPICGEVSLRQTWVPCALHAYRFECPDCADPDDKNETTLPRKFPYVGGRGSSPNA